MLYIIFFLFLTKMIWDWFSHLFTWTQEFILPLTAGVSTTLIGFGGSVGLTSKTSSGPLFSTNSRSEFSQSFVVLSIWSVWIRCFSFSSSPSEKVFVCAPEVPWNYFRFFELWKFVLRNVSRNKIIQRSWLRAIFYPLCLYGWVERTHSPVQGYHFHRHLHCLKTDGHLSWRQCR